MGTYRSKEETLGADAMRQLESQVMLRIMDVRWMNHLQAMDYLKTGIGLRAFGQRDPLVEYKEEAHRAFSELTSSMYEDSCARCCACASLPPWSRKGRRPSTAR